MRWLETLRSRGGALLAPAERLLQSQPELHLGGDFHGGSQGVVALARALEAHSERPPADDGLDDTRFVESAGALLALILIDHVRDARHATRDGHHRVRLGTHGFFDPFRAVECALDADDVRGELARELARAEAEARGQGPLSRFVWSFAARLADLRPELHIVDQFETRLRLNDGSEVDVAQAVRATVGEPAGTLRTAADRLIGLLPRPGGPSTLPFSQVRPLLRPRLYRGDALRDLCAAGAGALWSRPWAGPLQVTLLIQYQGRARYARADEVETWRAEGGDAHRAALENLARCSGDARWACVDTPDGPYIVGRSGDGLDSARALLPALHDVLSRELGTPLRLGLPHRDMLVACAATADAIVAQIAKRVRQDHARAPHALSDRLFWLDERGVHG